MTQSKSQGSRPSAALHLTGNLPSQEETGTPNKAGYMLRADSQHCAKLSIRGQQRGRSWPQPRTQDMLFRSSRHQRPREALQEGQ